MNSNKPICNRELNHPFHYSNFKNRQQIKADETCTTDN